MPTGGNLDKSQLREIVQCRCYWCWLGANLISKSVLETRITADWNDCKGDSGADQKNTELIGPSNSTLKFGVS